MHYKEFKQNKLKEVATKIIILINAMQ